MRAWSKSEVCRSSKFKIFTEIFTVTSLPSIPTIYAVHTFRENVKASHVFRPSPNIPDDICSYSKQWELEGTDETVKIVVVSYRLLLPQNILLTRRPLKSKANQECSVIEDTVAHGDYFASCLLTFLSRFTWLRAKWNFHWQKINLCNPLMHLMALPTRYAPHKGQNLIWSPYFISLSL